MTKIEKAGSLYFKRDDLFEFGGMYGAKVRAAKILCEKAKSEGYTEITSLGAKSSPQINIMASVCKELGLKAVGHTTTSDLQYDMRKALEKGADIHQHPCGYTNVLIKRAKDYAKDNNAFYLPFGMDDELAVDSTADEVESLLPYIDKIKRVVITAGSGINLAGVIKGFIIHNINIPILAIQVGFTGVQDILDKYIGRILWTQYCEIKPALQSYNEYATYTKVNGIDIDCTYEGKCVPFLQKDDLFWLVGKKEFQHEGKEIII